MVKLRRASIFLTVAIVLALVGSIPRAQTPQTTQAPRAGAAASALTTPMQEWGHNIGDDYFLVNYQQLADVLEEAREGVEPPARRRHRQALGRPADDDGDHHLAGQLREARDATRDLAQPARRNAEGLDRRPGAQQLAQRRQGRRVDRRRAARHRDARRAAAARARLADGEPHGRRDAAIPRRRDPAVRAREPRRHGPRVRLVHEARQHEHPRALQQVRRPRRQPRLLHGRARRVHEHRSRDVPRVVPADRCTTTTRRDRRARSCSRRRSAIRSTTTSIPTRSPASTSSAR